MNETVELKTITLEDNKTYAVIKEIENYVYLTNVEDPDNFAIRKDTGEYLEGLENETEFQKALKLFEESNKE